MKLSVNTVICATLILIFIYLFLLYHVLPNKNYNKYCNCKVYVGRSSVGGTFGRGVFARNKIYKDDIIEYGPALRGTKEEIFCGLYVDYVHYRHGSLPNYDVLTLGNGPIYNHSSNNNATNTIDGQSFYVVANRDIEKDEEIFTHYGDTWFSDRGIAEI
jgi:hypothetical protein